MKKIELRSVNLIFVLYLTLLLLVPLVNAQFEGGSEGLVVEKVAENRFIKIVFGDPGASLDSFGQGLPLGRTGAIIIHVAIWLMLFVAFRDIFSTFLPFSNKAVPWILGLGLAVIFANFGFIPPLISWTARVTAVFGAAAVFIGMIAAFAGFIGTAVAGNWLKYKIRSQQSKWAGKAGTHEAGEAIKQLIHLHKSMKE